MSPRSGSHWSPPEQATLRAAYITGAAVIIAALIGVLVVLRVGSSNGSDTHTSTPASRGPTSSTAPPTAPETETVPVHGIVETAGWTSRTFSDFVNAGKPFGPRLSAHQTVVVSCRVRGFAVQDGDRWWYRLASAPWSGRFYATADVFYNTQDTSGSPVNGVRVDRHVPIC